MSDDDQFSRDWMAEVNAKAKEAQQAKTETARGCTCLGCLAAPAAVVLVLICIAWLTGPSSPPRQEVAGQQQMSKTELDAMSLPRKMASINAGFIVPESHQDVASFALAIAKIRVANPNDSEQKICDLLVSTHEQVKKKEPGMTLLRFSQEMARAYER